MIFHRLVLLAAASITGSIAFNSARADNLDTWSASWTTSIQSAFVLATTPQGSGAPAYNPQPELSFALPNGTTKGATDQTFRFVIKPDLWGDTVRIKLSNFFGTQPVIFNAATIGLQSYQANVVPGTLTQVTFGNKTFVKIEPGKEIFSDPVTLSFVDKIGEPALEGRNLAVSVAVSGASGPASYHDAAFTTSYISPPNSGDLTAAERAAAFPYSTTSWFFLNELDVLAPNDTVVVVAFGDSITDGTFSTINGNDRWLNSMSALLHAQLGNHVSVVNEAIAGNAVSATDAGPSAISRLERDVIDISGHKLVVWLEGINDLGGLQTTAAPVIAGYKNVINRLHKSGILVIGATVTPSYVPGGVVPSNSPLAALSPAFAASYGSSQTNTYRLQLNNFILTSGKFDATADFAAATTDTSTGTLYAAFVPNSEGTAGDYLHPNRFGYQVMGGVAAQAVLSLLSTH